jgi:hypothetical protein
MHALDTKDLKAKNSITAYLESFDSSEFLIPHGIHNLYSAIEYSDKFSNFSLRLTVNESKNIWKRIVQSGEGIEFNRRHVGTLFKYDRSDHLAFVTVNYLLNIVANRPLSAGQLHEIEGLLNLNGRTLGGSIPDLKSPKESDVHEALMEVLKLNVAKTPLRFYRDYQDVMHANGFEMDLNQNDFKAMVAKIK